MSPSDYLRQAQLYEQYATQAGINYNEKLQSYLFRNDKSPTEFYQAAQADAQLRDNPALYKAYNEQLKAEGLDPLDKGGQLKFLLGLGERQYTQVWERASTRYAAEEAGLSVDRLGNALSIKDRFINEVAGKGFSPQDLQQRFEQVASDLLTTLPLSRIQHYQLSKKDIEDARFGGPKQAEVLQRMQHILTQEQAFEEQGSPGPQSYVNQGGQAATPPSQQRRTYSQ
jgi:hypothetical protein